VEEVKRLVGMGAVTPAIDQRFALDDVVDALCWVEDGHARGKVLIVP
jgi:NADPH:quinone reductase-like Zn-dependent oxidoreductase